MRPPFRRIISYLARTQAPVSRRQGMLQSSQTAQPCFIPTIYDDTLCTPFLYRLPGTSSYILLLYQLPVTVIV